MTTDEPTRAQIKERLDALTAAAERFSLGVRNGARPMPTCPTCGYCAVPGKVCTKCGRVWGAQSEHERSGMWSSKPCEEDR